MIFRAPARVEVVLTHTVRCLSSSAPLRAGDRTAPKREVNFDRDRWRKHKSVWRHFRHLLTIPNSSVLQRLAFPDLTVVFLSSGFITYYNTVSAEAVSLPPLPFTLCSLAVGLLTTFRTNTSYKRYAEARSAWGQLINSSRDLARQVAVHIGEKEQPGPRLRMAHLIKALPVALNFHLTTNGGHHEIRCSHAELEKVCKAEFEKDLRLVYDSEENMDDFQALVKAHSTTSGNVPLVVMKLMGDTIREFKTSDMMSVEMERQVTRMCETLGICEKILKTPIPTKFTRHTSRFVTLWCNLIPVALWPFAGMATVPASMFITYALLGIEDIGVQIEEPFDILPLRQYTTAVQGSVDILMQKD